MPVWNELISVLFQNCIPRRADVFFSVNKILLTSFRGGCNIYGNYREMPALCWDEYANCIDIPYPPKDIEIMAANASSDTKILREKKKHPQALTCVECGGFMLCFLCQSRVAPARITSGQVPRAPRLSEAPVGHRASHLQHSKRHQPRGRRRHWPHGFRYNSHEEPFHRRGVPYCEYLGSLSAAVIV